MQTIRQQIIQRLEQKMHTALDLSGAVKIKEKEVYGHLAHIEKSLKAQKKKLVITPFECRACGYLFENRKTLKPPGKCPSCKQSRIEPALYQIV